MTERSKEWWVAQAEREGGSEVEAGGTTAMEGLEEDSEDFTPEEAASAIPCQNVEKVIEHLRAQSCSVCQKQFTPIRHELKRLAKVLYWRLSMICVDEHESVKIVIRTDWIRGSL